MLFYNEDFLQKMGVEYFTGLLIHEMLHILFQHNHRAFPDYNLDLQNLAQDMVINSYIRKKRFSFFSHKKSYTRDRHDREIHGISTPELKIPQSLPEIPQTFISETRNSDPLWEDLYYWLVKKKKENQKIDEIEDITMEDKNKLFNDENPFEMDMIEDVISFKENNDFMPTGLHVGAELAKEKNEAVKNRLLFLASKDTLCAEEELFKDLSAFIEKTRAVDTTSWKKEIMSLVDYESKSHEWTYRSSRFNRRYFAQGIYSPGRMFREEEILTVAVDVSGSMTAHPEDLEAAFGVVESLMKSYRVYLICIDENVYIPHKEKDSFVDSKSKSPYRYKKGDWQFIKSGARGTTFFAPLFNDFMKHHKEMLLVITDGDIFDIHELRAHRPTLWVLPKRADKNFKAPFGRTVFMEIEEKV